MIYLDANASARLRPEAQLVLNELLLSNGPRNPSSVHQAGRLARSRLQSARKSILQLLNPSCEIRGQRLVFTSGATEACNQLVFGLLGGGVSPRVPGSIVTSAIEHPAMLEPIAAFERQGWAVRRVAPGKDGVVPVSEFLSAVDETTALVSLMAANNETGAVQPIAELARSLRAVNYRGPIISDFTQALGKTHLSAGELFDVGVNALAISGHKLGAPAGIGAFILSEGKTDVCFTLEPLLRGGFQEQGFRAGTENLFGASTFGEVCQALSPHLDADINRRRELREMLWGDLRLSLPGLERITPKEVEGEKRERALSNTLSVRFIGCRGDDLIVALDLEGLCASTGSACASGKQSVSHVMTAMGLDAQAAREVVRFSLDWDTTPHDINRAALIIAKVVNKMRGKGVTAELAKAA